MRGKMNVWFGQNTLEINMNPWELVKSLAHDIWMQSLTDSISGRFDKRIDMEAYRVGDLVFESSTHAMKRSSNDNIGWFICKTEEFVPFEDEEGGYYESYWHLEDVDGNHARWTNCRFLRVPGSIRKDEQWLNGIKEKFEL
jgi:hypothetical protein